MNRIDGSNPLATTRTQQGMGASGVDSASSRDRANESDGLSGGLDRVSLSSRGRIMAEATLAVSTAPDVRAERVMALKAAIANGTYETGARQVAERLLANGSFGVN